MKFLDLIKIRQSETNIKDPTCKKIGLIISAGYVPEDYRIREKSRKSLDQVVRYNAY